MHKVVSAIKFDWLKASFSAFLKLANFLGSPSLTFFHQSKACFSVFSKLEYFFWFKPDYLKLMNSSILGEIKILGTLVNIKNPL